MNDELDVYQGKSVGELGRDAAWFLFHTLVAIAVVAAIMMGGMVLHTDADSSAPKLLATLLAFVMALVVGFAVARVRHDRVAPYVWISAILFFAIVCVWVLDLPTGNGLCEHCGAVDKLTRTFFTVDNGSGLANGWGLVVGSWVPLALLGYAAGAQLAVGRVRELVVD
jgi:cytochrome bd-type quinol oxidase subunit 2